MSDPSEPMEPIPPLDGEARALLDAERDPPEPPRESRDRVLGRVARTVGIAGAVGLGAELARDTATSTGAGLAGRLLSGATIAKLGAACVAAALAIGAALHFRAPPPTPSLGETDLAHAKPIAPPTIAPMAPSASVPPRAAPAPAPPPAAEAKRSLTAGEPSRTTVSRSVGRDEPQAEPLAAERALLEQARAAVARGDGRTALAAIDRHERRFPRGQLVEERESLRVAALAAARRPDDARDRAARFRRRWPRSIFLPAVDAIVRALP